MLLTKQKSHDALFKKKVAVFFICKICSKKMWMFEGWKSNVIPTYLKHLAFFSTPSLYIPTNIYMVWSTKKIQHCAKCLLYYKTRFFLVLRCGGLQSPCSNLEKILSYSRYENWPTRSVHNDLNKKKFFPPI